jgi:outer membrane protein assembly factor BamB
VIYTIDRKGRLRSFSAEGDSTLIFDFNTPIEASFIVSDSVLYVGRIDGFVNALSLKDRKLLWDFETLGQISGSPNLISRPLPPPSPVGREPEGDVSIPTQENRVKSKVEDGKRGQETLNSTPSTLNSPPTQGDSGGGLNILIGSYDGSMYVLDAKSGKMQNRHATGYYINGTAAVWRNYMVFGGCDTWLRMVDCSTGLCTDSLQLDTYLPASPAILGDIAYEADYNGNIYEIRLKDGRFASHRKLVEVNKEGEDDASGLVSMPTAARDAVLAFTGERYISCFERFDGKLRWRKLLRGITGESSPIVCDDKVIVCTKDGHISLFDISDGKELWHYDSGEQIIASPAVIPGCFYILTSRGTIMKFQ